MHLKNMITNLIAVMYQDINTSIKLAIQYYKKGLGSNKE